MSANKKLCRPVICLHSLDTETCLLSCTGAQILSRRNSPLMSPKNLSPMIAILLIFGGTVFGVLGGLHAIYTLLDLRNPRRLVPVEPSVAQAMANSAVRVSRGGTDMWRAWIGFNFSHSLGLLLFAALAVWEDPESTRSRSASSQRWPWSAASIWFSACSFGFAFLPSASPLVWAASPPHGSCH